MKLSGIVVHTVNGSVAPSHEGAWIEIMGRSNKSARSAVAPSHEGAWIEICLMSATLPAM